MNNQVLADATDIAIQEWHRSRKPRYRQCHASPRLTIWLLVLMALYRDLSVYGVYQKLLSFLDVGRPEDSFVSVTAEALVKARARLGEAPLREIFRKQADAVQTRASFKKHKLWVIDASEFTIPDTPENVEEFGRRGDACYPSVKAVVLIDVFGRRVRECAWTSWRDHELTSASAVTGHLGPDDLLLLDSGYGSFKLFWELAQERKSHFVCRLSSIWNPEVVEVLSKGDTLVRVKTNKKDRAQFYRDKIDPNREMLCRLITFRVGDGETIRLLTNLIDRKKYPKKKLAELYHERWEIEVSFDELKNDLFSVRRGKQPTHFRSKKPEGVKQEAWGLLLCYNLVRGLMVEAAAESGEKPRDLSFSRTTRLLNEYIHFCVCPRVAQARIRKKLIKRIGRARIDRPRRPRSCCRKVKKKMTRFLRKRPGDQTDDPEFHIKIKFVTVELGKRVRERKRR